MLGIPRVRFLAHNWIFLVHPDSHETVRKMADMLQTGTLPPTLRLGWLKRNGDPLWLEICFMKRQDIAGHREDFIIGNVRKIREAA